MNEMNNWENNNQNVEQQNNVVQPEQLVSEPSKKEEKKSYCGLLVVFMVISLLLAGFIAYDKLLKKEEAKEPEQKEEIEKPEETKVPEVNVDEGIIVYGNGKIIESNVIKEYVGNYKKYDNKFNVVTGGIIISKNLSECKLDDDNDDKIVAIRIYLFDYDASDNNYYPVEDSILEFVRKSSIDGTNYSTVFEAHPTASTYEFYDLADDDGYYYK